LLFLVERRKRRRGVEREGGRGGGVGAWPCGPFCLVGDEEGGKGGRGGRKGREGGKVGAET